MPRTHNQQMADIHERDIAEWIEGSQTKASGSQWHAQMDAKNGINKVPFPIAGDGKATLGKSIGVSLSMWFKAKEQTFGEITTLFLRWYRDQSLRTVDLDLVVLSADDFKRILSSARSWEKHVEKITELVMAPPPCFPTEVSCTGCGRPLDTEGSVELLSTMTCEEQGLHDYTSTACLHAQMGHGAEHLHERCRFLCKFCGAECECACHQKAAG